MYSERFVLAIERVAIRVLKGGHNIPDEVVKRGFFKGLHNLKRYLTFAEEWYLLDNSKSEYCIIAKSLNGEQEIINFKLFNFIYNYGK